MRSRKLKQIVQGKYLLLATSVLLTGCVMVPKEEYAQLKAKETEFNAVAEALVFAESIKPEPLPNLPGDCTGQERVSLASTDGVDVALVKYDRHLGFANDRVRRCAKWYNDVKISRNQHTEIRNGVP